MASYVIGDVQGCYQSLLRLLDRIDFDPEKDKLWFAGDLVNRGPESLKSLRLIKEIATKVVLGNHDLHLLACYYGEGIKPKTKDTFNDILNAPDCDELMEWLRRQPLAVWSKKRGIFMSHAGLPHIWDVAQAYAYSKEVNRVIRGKQAPEFFNNMYGSQPEAWDEKIEGMERLRKITNYLTRMRFITPDGCLEFAAKETVESAPKGFQPWFDYPRKDPHIRLVFGHWAALGGKTQHLDVVATDTGCVWGGELTAVNLNTFERISSPSAE